MGFLRNEAAGPGVEEEYPKFYPRTSTALSHSPQQSLGQFHRLSVSLSFSRSRSLSLCARLDCKRQKQIDLRAEQATATAARLPHTHTMDVRFYPSAGGNAIPGDPPNLDFAHCLGYYNFNKVRNPPVWCRSPVLCCVCVATLVLKPRVRRNPDPD